MTKAALFEGAAFFYGKSTWKTEEAGQGKRLKRFFVRGSALRRLSMHGSGITPEDSPMPYTRGRGRGRRGSPRQGPKGEEKNEGKNSRGRGRRDVPPSRGHQCLPTSCGRPTRRLRSSSICLRFPPPVNSESHPPACSRPRGLWKSSAFLRASARALEVVRAGREGTER